MHVDLNLLTALDALLEEGSVGAAADRLHLSQPAMSRTLARIRKATGDPILVRAGRAMVPTPRALELRAEVRTLVERAQSVLAPRHELDLSTLDRVFTVVSHDAVVGAVGSRLLGIVCEQAPLARVRLLAEAPVDTADLRQGRVDLEVGGIGETASEVRGEHLASDRIVAVVRPGHPLTGGRVTIDRFADWRHITVSRRGRLRGPLDEVLAERGLSMQSAGSVPTVLAALTVVRDSSVIGLVAEHLCRDLIRTFGLSVVRIPVDLPPLRISQAWHQRYDVDPAHAWLRGVVRDEVRRSCAD